MNIYVSSAAAQQGEMTPFQAYAGTSDFASILNDMKKGLFPVGTNQPFPVNFASEENPEVNPMSPFSKNYTCNTREPDSCEILGPKSLGLA